MPEIVLEPGHLDTVRRILRERSPGVEIRAFGSRVTGNARRYSDLDLVVIGPEPDWCLLGRLKDAFSESDLPIRVDVLDWHGVSPAFRRVINERSVLIQAPRS